MSLTMSPPMPYVIRIESGALVAGAECSHLRNKDGDIRRCLLGGAVAVVGVKPDHGGRAA